MALSLRDFRNFESAALEPGPKATVIEGPNGQGKTNLLEAIYLLATLKPLRASRLAELPRFGTSRCRVEGTFALSSGTRQIAIEVEPGTRSAFVDGKRVRDLEGYFGGLSVVSFTPDDLSVLKGSPEGRRRYLDRVVFNRFPAFLGESREYARALKARNRLLREGAPAALIQAFDEPLARVGARLIVRRRATIDELAPRFHATLEALSLGALQASLRYDPPALREVEGEETIRVRLLAEFERRLPRDRDRRHTSIGPHADDLEVELFERSAKVFASQGQQRALVLSLKIGEIENLRERLGYSPLLLLDDVSSELDRSRNAQLMAYLHALPGQLLLTTTDPSLVEAGVGPDARRYRVRAGHLEAESSTNRD